MSNQQFHFIITAQWTGPTGANNVATESGAAIANGRTRGQVFNWIFDQLCAQHGAPRARTSILFFSLEPDDIVGVP